jgi:hypothetical protein
MTSSRRRVLLSGAALSAVLGAAPQAAAQATDELFDITDSETATIDGRWWDQPIVGGRTVDAVHRSVLLRFPNAAEAIAARLAKGRLVKAELVLTYDGYEVVPPEYTCRDGLGRKIWTDDPPSWHVQAWPLRQPWIADKALGPTFNASVNGRRFWTRYGATDPAHDRHHDPLKPQELSTEAHEARFDITRLLATDVLATDIGARLLALEECGFVLRKLETYDTRYRSWDAYEWMMPTGGHGLRFASPRIALAFRPLTKSDLVVVTLPPRLERASLLATDDGSRPTAVVPSPAEIADRARLAVSLDGKGREDWEIGRIHELQRLGGDRISRWANINGEAGYKAYQARLREVMAIPPRYWQGWDIQDYLLVWHLFRDLLPAPVQDHMKAYWQAWLQPDLPTEAFVHPQSPNAVDYWKRTRDWRGRASFFRDGYNYAVSTQGFNHIAAMGALLGGAMIDGAYPMADGRHGLERLPLRFWGFLDGSAQELLDHYYLSNSLSAQKMFADFAPTLLDRLMGRILVDRTMELLVSVYHPMLRRCVASSGRARLSGVLVEQDGIYGALHTVSKKGVVNYVDAPPSESVHGMPIWGYDFPPGRVAMQTLPSRWAPTWLAGLIDDKPLPSESTAAETIRGFFKPPLWQRSYLGRWHALGSADMHGLTVDVLGQWVRKLRASTRLEDLGTLTARYVANGPDLTTTKGGVTPQSGLLLTYQSRNRAIVFAKPHTNRERFLTALGKEDVSRLATVIGLWNFSEPRTWEIIADGKKIESFPHRLSAGTRILIRDGVSYLAILPLSATDLGRDVEIEIAPGIAGKADPSGAEVAPALTISIFNFKPAQPVAARDLDIAAITSRTYGGFVLEMGDAHQHGSFEGFVRHIDESQLTAEWHDDRRQLDVTFRSGGDLMEVGFTTDFAQKPEEHFPVAPGVQERAIPYRRLNGAWPYLPAGLERDTAWAQQGTTGRLEKNGAVLVTESGRKAYLMADPRSGAVVGYNPLPDPQAFSLSTRDGVSFSADGKVGLLRLEYRPWARECDITYALKADQDGDDMAKSFTISGIAQAPRVTLNGRPVDVRATGRAFQAPLA